MIYVVFLQKMPLQEGLGSKKFQWWQLSTGISGLRQRLEGRSTYMRTWQLFQTETSCSIGTNFGAHSQR